MFEKKFLKPKKKWALKFTSSGAPAPNLPFLNKKEENIFEKKKKKNILKQLNRGVRLGWGKVYPGLARL